MKLKHLTLRGFKSFADRTRLDFSTGMNVVVGPNGSGKSNILDAIAWVMGTQGTKSLRTERMEDVVFAGTETRPPLSRAEVALTFANDEQLVPLGLAEITITRRIFRDGTSEYELNGTECRLMDIQELLSDGGIGKQQHILVNQGQIGEILNARPEDHRAVIEEAAGVTKHRARRDRAIRRLERTDHDVERLNDILSEKKRALRPLKRQANAAERYDSVREEARALAMWLGAEELRLIRNRIDEATRQCQERTEVRDAADAELTALLGSLEGLRKNAGDVGAKLNRDTSAAARLETVRERLRRVGLVAAERRRSIDARLEGADERRDDLDAEQRDLVATLEALADREALATEQAARAEAALRAHEDEERALAEQIQLPTEGVVATLRGDLRSLETAAERDAAEADQIRSRLDVVQSRIADELAETDRLNGDIEATDALVTGLQDAYLVAQSNREAVQVTWENDEAEVAEQRLAAAGAGARVEALEAALTGLVDEQASEIARHADGITGLLASQLDVPSDLADAVDAALGVWRDAYVTDGAASVRAAVEALKTSATGGISFVTSDTRPVGNTREIAKRFGVDAMVDMLGKEADPVLASRFVGDVVVVQGWIYGWEIVTAEPSVRAVTPEGDVISVDGVSVAQPDGAGPAALEAARVAVEQSVLALRGAEDRLHVSRRAFDAARETERLSLEALEAEEAKVAGLTEALALIGRSRVASAEEARRLTDRLEALDEIDKSRAERIASLRDRVAEFQGEEAARQAAWDALNERRQEVAQLRDESRKRREEATGELASIVERRRMSERRLAIVQSDLQQLTLLPDADEARDALQELETRADRVSGVVGMHVETLRGRQRALRDQSGSANADLVKAEERREAVERERRSAAETVQELEIELAELRVRDQAVAEGLRRDADAEEDVALAIGPPVLEGGIDPKERLAALEADLRRMGPINPLASAEYAEIASGVELLENQLDDLNASRSEIKKVVAALDDQMESLFEDAFAEIAGFYEENFSLVFPGGTGRLRLTESDEPLTAGVLVEAQPAGKKVGRLSLLSGGERSLAALAFLFAVFRARPSPFYVLDEVEAALDDANLHRFLTLVETLRDQVQLVIITHQQQTMHAADVLYGVTMEPGESSKVISKRMSPITV
ncbi:MAG: chromosome segregation protein SMC [Acidimicrobiia bacterium]|nr:chromosome segregation protein SMC [Acidimicrobiia bacterium]